MYFSGGISRIVISVSRERILSDSLSFATVELTVHTMEHDARIAGATYVRSLA